jgi:hypothetical protein
MGDLNDFSTDLQFRQYKLGMLDLQEQLLKQDLVNISMKH